MDVGVERRRRASSGCCCRRCCRTRPPPARPNRASKITLHSPLKKGTETPTLRREVNSKPPIPTVPPLIATRFLPGFLLMARSSSATVEASHSGVS